MENNQTTPIQNSGVSPQLIAILAYMTLIGWIVALILNQDKKDALAAFHIRQGLGLMVIILILFAISFIPFLGWLINIVGMLLVLVLWIIGLIGAIQSERKLVPVLGEK